MPVIHSEVIKANLGTKVLGGLEAVTKVGINQKGPPECQPIFGEGVAFFQTRRRTNRVS
jgi:hypothetical protein